MLKTQTIAGVELSLVEGQRYVASRPWAERGRQIYPVTICLETALGEEVRTIPGLTLGEADGFLAAFNTSGNFGFEGRIW